MTITIAAEGSKAWLLDVDARQLNIDQAFKALRLVGC